MNALKMMEDQHAEIETRLLKLETEALPSVQRQRLLHLATALHVHSTIEQKLFYPAAKARSTEAVIFAHIESHRAMNAIASELLGLNASSERYRERLAALRSRGVLALGRGTKVRLVTHSQVDESSVDAAIGAFADILGKEPTCAP